MFAAEPGILHLETSAHTDLNVSLLANLIKSMANQLGASLASAFEQAQLYSSYEELEDVGRSDNI